MDGYLYAIILFPAMSDLLGTSESAVIGWYGGIVLSIFMIGWALGGLIFGPIADRYGRAKTMAITILIYATFTGLCGVANSWWELAIYRFLTGLGIGGEWAAGAALVAETWPERSRAKAAAALQLSGGVGFFLAALINLLVGGYGWRWVFVVGAFPAILLWALRYFVHESERWLETKKAPSKSKFSLAEVFSKELRRDTIVGSLLAVVAVFGFWAVTTWIPPFLGDLLSRTGEALDTAAISRTVSLASMIMTAGSIPGYILMGWLADRVGRKFAFAMFYVGALVSILVTFLQPWPVSTL